MLTDTHAHLNFDPFYQDCDPYIDRARESGVGTIIVPGIDIASSEKAILLADRYPEVYAAVGIHPHDCADKPDDYLRILEELARHPKVVAIGEIGMDFFRDYAPADLQMSTFRDQIALASDLDLPMIVHGRQADDAVREALDAGKYFRLQAHCYTGSLSFAQELLDRGALISFTNVITFAADVAAIAAALPLDRLMLETDSPFMAPKPWRGKTCEPFMVKEVARKYSELFQTPFEDVARICAESAHRFFGLNDMTASPS